MTELSTRTAALWFPGGTYRELGGGVSNRVIAAEAPGGRAVLKQSLGRLRVEREWLSDRHRVFREAAAMRWTRSRVRGGRIPRVLAEDRENFVVVMEAAPPDAETWKSRLFRGDTADHSARDAGTLLGSLVAASSNHSEARALFGDQTVFHQLRIEPYYRFTAAAIPRLAPFFHALAERSGARRFSLVHGDFSPKNLLVAGPELWAIDWEVAHFGDPSFDVAFLLNHLLLKTIAMPPHRQALTHLALAFLEAFEAELPGEAHWIPAAALEHLPALLMARVHGKSPAEYLDVPQRQRAAALALDLIGHPAATAREAFER